MNEEKTVRSSAEKSSKLLNLFFYFDSGYKVADTMSKGILQVDLYTDSEKELMLGFVSALASSALWLLCATFLKLPISGTHSIVGSSIGFSLVARGTEGVAWTKLGKYIATIKPLPFQR